MAEEPDGTTAGVVFAKHLNVMGRGNCNVSAIAGAAVVIIFSAKLHGGGGGGRGGPIRAFNET